MKFTKSILNRTTKDKKLTVKDVHVYSTTNKDGVTTYFLNATYQYETPEKVVEFNIPKIELPINDSDLNLASFFEKPNNLFISAEYKVELKSDKACLPVRPVYDCKFVEPVYFTEKVISEKTRDMTIAEIEEKLGYKIRIVKEDKE